MKTKKTKGELYDLMRRGLLMFLAALFELVTDEKPEKPEKPKRDSPNRHHP